MIKSIQFPTLSFPKPISIPLPEISNSFPMKKPRVFFFISDKVGVLPTRSVRLPFIMLMHNSHILRDFFIALHQFCIYGVMGFVRCEGRGFSAR